MIILTLNCGSSSVKYQLYEWQDKKIIAKGIVEKVGARGSFISHYAADKGSLEKKQECPNHKKAIELITSVLLDSKYGVLSDLGAVKAVGHRVVHGAEDFSKSTIIDNDVIEKFKAMCKLSPLHNPANITGIEAAQAVFPGVPHCAIMDTAWHQTMPQYAYLYALPYEWYTKYRIRKYGFHGTSFLYVAKRAAMLLGKKTNQVNLILLHIGNGASANAVKNGISVDTSMGLTPLPGLVMGTRCGDIDPAISFYVMRKAGYTAQEVENTLNKKSGVLGITGRYLDRRDIIAAAAKGDKKAQLAIEIETYGLKKYIGTYLAVLGRVDALVFTAGVGEMSPLIRAKCLQGLEGLGIEVDPDKNALSVTRNAETDITGKKSRVKIFVIPTDEEIVMTEDTYALLKQKYDVHTNFAYSFQRSDYVNKAREQVLQNELKEKPELNKIIARIP